MASRHVFTQRLKSGVIFSAPGNLLAVPEGGWGDDTPITRQKKPKIKLQSRGLDHFSHWVAKVTPYDEPYDSIDSFTPGKDTRGFVDEYRPYSVSPYPETEVETAAAKIPEVTLSLPMLNVSLTATVDGTVAHTELVQKFHNPSDIIIDAAKHVFPLYDGAVITSFECTIGDERRVRGVVKPKVQARKEFEEAVHDKVAAPALLEEHTPEIFETSLGNIPANTTVEIKITYVQELKVVMMESEATEGIALTIPMSIAPRYSKAPIEWEPASKLPEEKLDIWIKVMDNGRVNHEGCDEESGHLLQFEGSKPVEYSNLSEKDVAPKTYYVWHHVSEPAVLRKDFVFVVQMNEGHHIKSRAIACPADDKGPAAMIVNIRPNDLFRNAIIPQSFTGEILFLLDQSGSMGWTNGSPDYGRRGTGARKIDVMREAMLLALSGIPSTCVFNVISWGSATMGLWETSRAHTKENIKEAKTYVSQVEADMGGTDLLRALESVVKRRVQDRGSTQIIILTDGELESEDSIQFIWKKRQLFGDSIRFFALGIGDEVSHRLVESIAECGGGYSDVVHTTQTPRWHDRLNRLLKSALEPNSWSCDIDLGSGFERKSLVDYKLEQQTTSESDKTPYIQGPFPISSLHPFSFASISFLVDLRHGGELPKAVTISTTTAGAKKKTYELPIEQAPGNNGTIHRLVAKSVLLDLQDEIKRGTAETQIAKANAETIGTMYSITSKWTSFVAISENQPTQTVEEQKMNHYKALFDEIDIDELLNNVIDDKSLSSGSSGIFSYSVRQHRHGIDSMGSALTSNIPLDSVNPLTTGRVLESASGIPISAPMPRYAPATSSSRQSQLRFTGNIRRPPAIKYEEHDDLPSEEDNDESGHLPPAPMAHCVTIPESVEPQGSDDGGYATTSQSHGVSDLLEVAPGPRPREIQDSSEFRAQAANVSDDVRLPTRERSYEDNSSTFIGADFPLYPNDSDWRVAESLERTREETTNDSQSVLPPPMTEFAHAYEAPALTAKLPFEESYAQEAHTPRRSESAYPVPSADEVGHVACFEPYAPYVPPIPSRHFPRPKRTVIATSERLRERVNRRKESAKAEIPDEPMVPPSVNRGFAIPAGIIEQAEPHESDEDGTGKPTEASEETEVVERKLELTDTEDVVPPHIVAISDTADDPLTSRQWHALAHKLQQMRESGISITSQNPPVTSCLSDDENRPVIAPPPSDPSLLGPEPQSVTRDHIPSGPKFPTYRALPIPVPPPRTPGTYGSGNEAMSATYIPRIHNAFPQFDSLAGSAGSPRGSFEANKINPQDLGSCHSDHDLYHGQGSESSLDSPSPPAKNYGPLDWQFAVECQDGQGLFDLDEKRRSLHLHFCPETVTKFGLRISELLSRSSTLEEERDDISARILDTLMMVECYKTHRAQEEDTWDLMMERAWDAVISALGLADEEETLEELAGQLRGAMMHAHYVAATGVKDSEKDDSPTETVRCPACAVVWLTTRRFFCPFDHDSDNDVDEFTSWDGLWKHQVDQGHIVCPQEVV
ncbi:hypothetical protein H9Q72_010294 [Fusarium xylarioides]|uniref:Vault poly n=1 Tax=Fusarium xylarioides TaxID=221167 RepID=A0A9P7HJ36_9HYPO|nr:hypothetical protein H9Q72_010294 [Fusarium xylarioides]